MSSLVDRIIQFLESKNENISSFSARCGLANGAINKALKKKGSLSSESISRILNANPDLSADWLFGRPLAENSLFSEPPEKYSKTEKPKDWTQGLCQEMQEIRQRIAELERKTKDL